MSTVLLGTVRFTALCLDALCDAGLAPAMVLGRRASPGNADFTDVVALAAARGVPGRYVDRMRTDDEGELVASIRPDILLVLGWPFIVPAAVRAKARVSIGAHPAPLPVGRGRHPIVWAIALGLEATALTFFELTDAPDAGAIYRQREISLCPEDDAGTLYDAIEREARASLPELIRSIAAGTARPTAQDESRAVTWRKRTDRDSLIDWRMSSTAIDRLVRALTRPYVGAHIVVRGRVVRVWKVAAVRARADWAGLEPGRVIESSGDRVRVRTSDGAIDLLEHDLAELPPSGSYIDS